MDKIAIHQIGYIRNDLKNPPLIAGENGLEINEACICAGENLRNTTKRLSEIQVDERYLNLLDGIDDYSHIMVVYWGHEISEQARSLQTIHPAGRKDYAQKGIFSTFSPARPNPILITIARLIQRDENLLVVSDLDAIDNSPVLDIKPYVPLQFPNSDVVISEWMENLMKEFSKN